MYRNTYVTDDTEGEVLVKGVATATYLPQTTAWTYIAAGTGILVLVGTIVYILMYLSKKKKEEEK